jgi:molybdopterin molybdotransferase
MQRRVSACRSASGFRPARVGTTLQPGTAARIFTGAPIPAGADAVIMQERCEHGENGVCDQSSAASPGENIRRAGEDIAPAPRFSSRRHQAAAAGHRAGRLGRLAGIAGLSSRARRRIFHRRRTGACRASRCRRAAIYNSNRYALRALLEGWAAKCATSAPVPDNLEATRDALRARLPITT